MEDFDKISFYFELKSQLIRKWNKVGLFNINKTCEFFYGRLLNLLYDWHLENTNAINNNSKGIDLLYKGEKIVIQVSSICSKSKIQDSLDKAQQYEGYQFYFVSIAKSTDKVKKYKYKNGKLLFLPNQDILDDSFFLNQCLMYPEKMSSIRNLFIAFFPWLKYIESTDISKEQDKQMLHDFFEYFSVNYMDEYLQSPERLRYELWGSYSCWIEKWQMSGTYFVDDSLSFFMHSFMMNWSKAMCYEDWYIDEENGYHYIQNWKNRNIPNSNFNQLKYKELQRCIAELKKAYDLLIDYLKKVYQLNLNGLSQQFEQSYVQQQIHNS